MGWYRVLICLLYVNSKYQRLVVVSGCVGKAKIAVEWLLRQKATRRETSDTDYINCVQSLTRPKM